jgi:hypothetical protein
MTRPRRPPTGRARIRDARRRRTGLASLAATRIAEVVGPERGQPVLHLR